MISILAATVLGSWTYTGFLADPAPAPAPAPVPAPAPAPEIPSIVKTRVPAKAPRLEAPNSLKAAAITPPAAPSPGLPGTVTYRLTDASGQTWEHPDSTFLSSFVAARNRSFGTNLVAPPVTFFSSSPRPTRSSRCPDGRCP